MASVQSSPRGQQEKEKGGKEEITKPNANYSTRIDKMSLSTLLAML
jgi:hypothetical protein